MDWRWAAAGGAGHIVSPRAQHVRPQYSIPHMAVTYNGRSTVELKSQL